MTYYTTQGDQVTAEQIKASVAAGTARIIYYRMDNGTGQSLSLNSPDIDTRDECYSMWDEQWSIVPTLQQALQAAYCD